MTNETVSIFSDHVCELGEGPTFDPVTGTLFWFDIVNGKMIAQKASGLQATIHDIGEMASALAIIDEHRQLIATETGLYVRDVATGKLSLHTAIEANNPKTRSNDARVHPCGAFWVGTMGKSAEQDAGAIYWSFKGELRTLYYGISIPNSIAFSSDGTVAYFTDSATGVLMRTKCIADTGLPEGEAKPFADRGGGVGNHDGSVVDMDGTLWNARWGEGRITAYAPDGKLVRSITLPAIQPTCPAFIGKDADRLIVTSAWSGMDKDQRTADPLAGKTFLVDVPVRGRFEPRVLI